MEDSESCRLVSSTVDYIRFIRNREMCANDERHIEKVFIGRGLSRLRNYISKGSQEAGV